MHRNRNVLVSLAAIFAVIFWAYLCVNQTNQKVINSSAVMTLVRTRNFPVLPHPMNLTDATDLVKKLSNSKPVKVRPINQEYMNINYTLKPKCNFKGGYDILLMIKTSPSNWENRMQFRTTWANPNYLSQFEIKIKYAFVIGKTDVIQAKTGHNLRNEIDQYHDFLVGDFLDTYRNLTHKTMFGIRWAVEHCPNFKFYVSFDDDSYISIANLIKFFRDPYNYPNIVSEDVPLGKILQPSDDFYSGHTYPNGLARPNRNKKDKFYVSIQEYPLKIFPTYVAGYFVAMSRETVQNFYFLSPYVLPLAMEDVYLGLMANKLKLMPLDMTDVVTQEPLHELESLEKTHGNILNDIVFIHHVQPPTERTRIWRLLNVNRKQ